MATERQIGMGIGPIPRSSAIEYATQAGVTDADEIDRFWDIISRVDREQLRLMQLEIKQQSEDASSERRSRTR